MLLQADDFPGCVSLVGNLPKRKKQKDVGVKTSVVQSCVVTTASNPVRPNTVRRCLDFG